MIRLIRGLTFHALRVYPPLTLGHVFGLDLGEFVDHHESVRIHVIRSLAPLESARHEVKFAIPGVPLAQGVAVSRVTRVTHQ